MKPIFSTGPGVAVHRHLPLRQRHDGRGDRPGRLIQQRRRVVGLALATLLGGLAWHWWF